MKGVLKGLMGEEPNKLVAKAKQSVVKRFSSTRMQSLFEVVEIGWYLAALERGDEARSLMDELADPLEFTGSYDLWTPVANAMCLSARYTTNAARRKKLLARLVKNPVRAKIDRSIFKLGLERSRQMVADAKVLPQKKIACVLLAQALQEPTFYEQTAGLGFHYDAWFDVPKLTKEIEQGLASLRGRLA